MKNLFYKIGSENGLLAILKLGQDGLTYFNFETLCKKEFKKKIDINLIFKAKQSPITKEEFLKLKEVWEAMMYIKNINNASSLKELKKHISEKVNKITEKDSEELKIFKPKIRYYLYSLDKSIQISGYSEKNMHELREFLDNCPFKGNLFILNKEGQTTHLLNSESLKTLSYDIYILPQ